MTCQQKGDEARRVGSRLILRTIFKGYQINHNFAKQHEGLKGQTPAEASGIIIKGENKWITLIQNSK
ncbi:MAG: hypothetical protein ACRDF4_12365 [Rhabdochlamydiaceae bacterium]